DGVGTRAGLLQAINRDRRARATEAVRAAPTVTVTWGAATRADRESLGTAGAVRSDRRTNRATQRGRLGSRDGLRAAQAAVAVLDQHGVTASRQAAEHIAALVARAVVIRVCVAAA